MGVGISKMKKYININQNGLSIRSKLYCTDMKNIKSVVVFGHGFSGHKDNRAAEKLAARIQKRHKDVALIVFDWPCHGDDASNKLRLADCMKYLDNVIGYMKSRFCTDKIYGCATSFGGYLFLKYISEKGNPFIKLALRCPAIDMYDVLTERIMSDDDLSVITKNKPVLIGFDRKVKVTKEFLTELKENDITASDYASIGEDTVIIHGTKDEIVPFDVVEKFADDNGIAFYPVDGADHRFSDPQKMDTAIDRIVLSFSMKK